MTPKNKMSHQQILADSVLVSLAQVNNYLAALADKKADALAVAAAPFEEDEAKWTQEKKDLEDEIQAIMKNQKEAFFPLAEDEELLDLPHGRLRRAIIRRAKRAKKMVDKLKIAGRQDLVKVTEKADWDKIDLMTAEEMMTVGTEQKKQEVFEYETN